jgi:hypothetical protein
MRASWSSWAGSQEKIQTEIDFVISNEFGFWQDFEDFYKETLKEFGHEDFF